MDVFMTFLVGVFSGLAAMYIALQFRWLRLYFSLPFRFARRMQQQIENALRAGKDNSIMHARVIVASRKNLAESLDELGDSMNSELSKLEEMLSQEKSKEEIFLHIQSLGHYWRNQQIVIAVKIDKLLSILGH